MPNANRGDVWLADLGIAGKIRPCLVASISPEVQDRALLALVPHTTSVRGSRFEVVVPKRFLEAGAFDVQGLVAIPLTRLQRKLGNLLPEEMALVDEAIKRWLGLH